MRLPGLGPKTARRIWQELGITTVAALQAAAEAQRAARARRASAPGTEEKIADGARAAEGGRRPARAARCSGRRCRSCARSSRCSREHPAVGRGLARRLGAPHARDRARPRHHRDRDRPGRAGRRTSARCAWVVEVAAKGATKATVVSHDGLALRPARRAARELRQPAAALHRLEGPQRRAARGCGAARLLRLGVLDHRGRDRRGAPLRDARRTSTRFLGYDWIPPELREDGGELAAARRRRRCRSSSSSATCAATCTRTRPGRTARTRSRTMVAAARCTRLRLLRDLRPLAAAARRPAATQQSEAIDALNELVAPFRILKGIEVNIRPDGDARRRRRRARDARLGRRLGRTRGSTTTRPSGCSRRWRARTSTASATRPAAGSASAQPSPIDSSA